MGLSPGTSWPIIMGPDYQSKEIVSDSSSSVQRTLCADEGRDKRLTGKADVLDDTCSTMLSAGMSAGYRSNGHELGTSPYTAQK